MKKSSERISNNSIWLSATPSPLAMALPFYIIEAGHFCAEPDYEVERSSHDSFLLLYTVGGCGQAKTGSRSFTLDEGQAAVIDCHKYHSYSPRSGVWDFFWVHFKGISVHTMLDILYPAGEDSITLKDCSAFGSRLAEILAHTGTADISGSISLSSAIHELFCMLINSAMANEQGIRKSDYNKDIEAAVNFIKTNYAASISIDDMIHELHVSKYHFIRLFNRTMGVTPYSYLTAFRINMAKTLLRTTDKAVSAIAEECGFLDTSNFISQFKKRTGQKPTEYRNDFS